MSQAHTIDTSGQYEWVSRLIRKDGPAFVLINGAEAYALNDNVVVLIEADGNVNCLDGIRKSTL